MALGDENTFDQLSILLQFPKFSRGFRVTDFDEFIREQVGVDKLDFFGRLSYPNQWQMRVSDPNLRERLIRIGRTRINTRSCWLYPLNQQEIRGFVHWLPNSVTNDQLKEQLKLYGDVLFVETEKRTLKGRTVDSDSRYYGLILPEGAIKENIPHFLKINGFLCLVIVRGRELACFHCKEVGHRRAECQKYNEKLANYCHREPNSAQPRLRSRGRRHLNVKTEAKGEIAEIQVSSSANVATELKKFMNRKDIGKSIDERIRSDDISAAASLSETKIKVQDIIEALQTFKRDISENLLPAFENFEKKISRTLAGENLPPYTGDQIRIATPEIMDTSGNMELEEQTIRDPEEISREDNAETGVTRTKDDATQSSQYYRTESDENIYYEFEKMAEDAKSTAKGSTDISDRTSSTFHSLKSAKETFENTFKKLEEFEKSCSATQMASKGSEAAMSPKLGKAQIKTDLDMLEQGKQVSSEYCENSFKKLEEEIDKFQLKLDNEKIDADTQFIKDHIQHHREILKKAKDDIGKTLQSSFAKLEVQVGKEMEADEITTKSSADSRTLTKPLEKLEKDFVGEMLHGLNKDLKVDEEIKNWEKYPTVEERPEETIQIESNQEAQDLLKTIPPSDSYQENKNEEAFKKTFIDSKALESHVSNIPPKAIDELQANINKIFSSIFSNDKLLTETVTILNQVESEINEIVEETKIKLKADF